MPKGFKFLDGSGYDDEGKFIPAPAPPTITTQPAGPPIPIVPTAANGFGTNLSSPYVSEYDQLSQQRYQTSQQPIDTEAIRKQKLAEFQAQIDATNQIYNNLIAKAGVEGQGRVGQSRAIQARSGTLNSGRGAAQTEQVVGFNRGIESDIEARRQAQITAIMTESQNRADAEIAKREEAKRLGADAYLTYLAGTEERKKTNASAVLQSLLAQGLKIEDIAPEQFTQIANSLRMTLDELTNVYKGELSKAAKAAAQVAYERSLKDREFGLEVGKFGFEQNKFGAEFGLKKDEFGLKRDEFGFEKQKFGAELGLKYDELNRLLTNDQLDAAVKSVEIQKKLAEIQEINFKNGTGSKDALQNDKNLQNVNDSLEAVNGLFDHPGMKSAVGAKGLSSLFGLKGDPIAGTKAADFKAQLDRVKSLITLPQLEKLRGLGAMSDREFATLSAAASALNRDMTQEAFKTELDRVKKALESTKQRLETNSFFNEFETGGSEGTNPKGNSSYLKTLGPITGIDGSKYWKWGLDVDLKKGDPVKAPANGKVLAVKSGYNGGFGNQLRIQTDDGKEIWLSHLDKLPDVKPGARFKAGQILALGGNTGKTYSNGGDGSHLDITMPKPGGGYYAAREVKKYLDNKFV